MATGPLPARSGTERWPGELALRWLALLALVFLLPLAKPFLLPVVVALLLAIVLAGPVRALHRRGISEPVGALIVVATLAALVGAIASLLVQPASEWLERAPSNMNQFMRSLDRLRDAIPLLRVTTESGGAESASLGDSIATQGWTITRVVLDQLTGLAMAVASTIILLYFMLASEHWLVIRLMEHVPGRRARLNWLCMGRSVQREVAHYLWTMTLMNVVLGTATGLALWAIGLPNPLLWGTVTAVLNYVPYLGPLVIGALLFMAGILQFEELHLMVAPPLAFFGLNVIEAYVLTPLVMGKRLDLNPVFVFVSVMFWGWVWGVAGALVSVPVLLAIRNAMRHSRRWRNVSYWLEQPAPTSKTIGSMVRPEPRAAWPHRWRWHQRAAVPPRPAPTAAAPAAPALPAPPPAPQFAAGPPPLLAESTETRASVE